MMHRYPRVGDLLRAEKSVSILGTTYPPGTVALVIGCGPESPVYSTVLDMQVIVEGRQHSIYATRDFWRIINEAR